MPDHGARLVMKGNRIVWHFEFERPAELWQVDPGAPARNLARLAFLAVPDLQRCCFIEAPHGEVVLHTPGFLMPEAAQAIIRQEMPGGYRMTFSAVIGEPEL